MSDFWNRVKKINTIQLNNFDDPLLSEFKHHFVILKVYLPRKMNLQNFAEKVPEGFGLAYNLSNSIYIAQLVNVYDEDLVDIAIGFRRDETAIQIARGDLKFKQDNRVSQVELSNGFKIFMQELRKEEHEQQKMKDQFTNFIPKLKSTSSLKSSNPKPQSKQLQTKVDKEKQKNMKQAKNKMSKSRSKSKSRSRSRSRSREKKKKQIIFNRISSTSQVNSTSKSLKDRLGPGKSF